MTTRRYDQFCGLAHSLDLIGERWALLVVRELLLGPKRFNQLVEGLPGVATNTLTTRLESLERDGVIERRVLGPPANIPVYALTARGAQLRPILLSLVRWGAPSLMQSDPEYPPRADSVGIALLAFFNRQPLRLDVVLDMPTGRLRVTADGSELSVCHASGDESPSKIVATEQAVFAQLVRAKPFPKGLRITGDDADAARLFEACRIA